MLGKKNRDMEINLVATTLPVFLESYNKSIPLSFPQASVKMLKQFQTVHPTLFRQSDEWSIDKHRKKLMDWLSSYREIS